jgi:hypothetical protein
MSTNIFKSQFSAGVLSPSLHGRVDASIYANGASEIENGFVRIDGGVINRGGTTFVGQAKSNLSNVPDTRPVRLIPFQFNPTDSYVLEFGHKYMRVIRNGEYVLAMNQYGNTATNFITNITQSSVSATVTTKDPHGYNDGDWVYFTGIGGMSQINERIAVVRSHTTDTFVLDDLDGYPFDTSNFTAYTVPSSGSSNGRVYEIFTKFMPYEAKDVFGLTYAQSADVMTLTHEGYTSRLLTRQGHAVWKLEEVDFKPSLNAPVGIGITSTHIDGFGIKAISNANPAVIGITTTSGIVENGMAFRISGAVGMTEVNGNAYTLGTYQYTASGVKYFELLNTFREGVNTTAFGIYTADSGSAIGSTLYRYKITCVDANGGESRPASAPVVLSKAMSALINAGDTPPKILLEWNTNSGASSYNVYRQREVPNGCPSQGSQYGYIGTTTTSQFTDQNTLPDFSQSPPEFYNPFRQAPETALISGITKASPMVVTTVNPHGFDIGDRIRLSDILGMTQANDLVGEIDTVPTTSKFTLVSITDGTSVDSSSFSTYTSGGIATSETPQNSPSCSAYYQQRRVFGGSPENPQTLWFSQSGDFDNMDRSNPIKASDSIEVTLSSTQINKIKHIVPLASLLVLTVGGCFRVSGGDGATAITPTNIQSIPQTYSGCGNVQPIILNNDVLYSSSGSTNILALAYNFYQDSYQTQDLSIRARHLVDGFKIVDWAYSKDPYNLIHLIRSDGKLLTMTYLKEAELVAWSSGNTAGEYGVDTYESICCVVEGDENVIYTVTNRYIENQNGGSFRKYVERFHNRSKLYQGKRDTRRGHFLDCGVFYDGEPINILDRLHHLEGRTVGVVVDGSVLPEMTVTNGTIELPKYGSVISVGLPYTTRIKTLPLDVGNGQISGKTKSIKAVTARVVDTRGLKIGTEAEDFTSYKEITQNDDWTKLPLLTGDLRFNMFGNQTTNGCVIIEQELPLPMEVSGLILEVTIGDTP